MPIGTSDNFAHGTYGDLSGVTFYGPPVKGFWEDRFAVSDRFIDPIFRAILDRADQVPKVAEEWNALTDWTDTAGRIELTLVEVTELIGALTAVARANLTPHVAEFAVTPEECLRCASAIADFLRDRIDRGLQVYVERD